MSGRKSQTYSDEPKKDEPSERDASQDISDEEMDKLGDELHGDIAKGMKDGVHIPGPNEPEVGY